MAAVDQRHKMCKLFRIPKKTSVITNLDPLTVSTQQCFSWTEWIGLCIFRMLWCYKNFIIIIIINGDQKHGL